MNLCSPRGALYPPSPSPPLSPFPSDPRYLSSRKLGNEETRPAVINLVRASTRSPAIGDAKRELAASWRTFPAKIRGPHGANAKLSCRQRGGSRFPHESPALSRYASTRRDPGFYIWRDNAWRRVVIRISRERKGRREREGERETPDTSNPHRCLRRSLPVLLKETRLIAVTSVPDNVYARYANTRAAGEQNRR